MEAKKIEEAVKEFNAAHVALAAATDADHEAKKASQKANCDMQRAFTRMDSARKVLLRLAAGLPEGKGDGYVAAQKVEACLPFATK